MKEYIKIFAVYFVGVLFSPYLFMQWLILKRKGLICDYEKYMRVSMRYYLRLLRLPNLIMPLDYNEKITWLKLFDSNVLKIECCDKYDARRYIVSKIGEGYLPKNYYVGKALDRPIAKSINVPFVIKTTHDQGGVYFCNGSEDIDTIEKDVIARIKRRYGFLNYEWPYLKLVPKVIYEEYLNFQGKIPDDYKFHCVDGKVKWLQYITDRGIDTKEGIYDRLGNKLSQRLDIDMKQFSATLNLESQKYQEMISLAEKLADEFKYIRVDMYCTDERIYIGELTFFPLGGLYKSPDVDYFGSLMNFDTNPGVRINDNGE